MNKIHLTLEKETLLIPLVGKGREYEKDHPILIDKKAAEIVSQLSYDFSELKIPEKTNLLLCIRAKLMDHLVRDFLAANKDSVALHLGCGLDSRYHRIGHTTVDWYDVDFEEVIELRGHFFQETDHYHMVASSVTEAGWLNHISAGKPTVVVAEGLFMYLTENEIKQLIGRLKERTGSYTLIFDAYSVLTARKAGKHPSLKKTGAKIQWGLDDPLEITRWDAGIEFMDEKYFTAGEVIKSLDLATRMMFKLAGLFPFARRAHRLLIYNIRETGRNHK